MGGDDNDSVLGAVVDVRAMAFYARWLLTSFDRRVSLKRSVAR